MRDFFHELGINVGISVAGFFGSLIMVGKTSAYELRKTIFSILAGTCAANYLTPLVTDIMTNLSIQDYQFAIAFILGFLGLKGIEMVVDNLMKKNKI